MAEDKVDLPSDLISFKGCGIDDNVTSENGIPLSPQWLYAKPSDCKPGLSASSGKDAWRLEGSQDKKDWRKNAPDIESSRGWREEERETGLLGRRERRKEGDKENEYHKIERRADNVSVREISDPRSIPSSDRWNEVSNRNSGHESRRDSKWSSRWGPEDKTKDSRIEKKVDPEKEDAHNEKRSVVCNVASSEADPRDKRRPRHKMETQSGGSSVCRSAPGFGLDKGRVDGPTAGFSPGRGRSNIVENFSIGSPPAAGPLGAMPINTSETTLGISGSSTDAFRYPRGKLLDIYRKNKNFSSFNTVPEGLEEVPTITHSDFVEPMAFATPYPDEEALLKDIWKGKITSSEACPTPFREKMLQGNDIETGDDGIGIIESRSSTYSSGGNGECFAINRQYDSQQKLDGVSCTEEPETAEIHSHGMVSVSSKTNDTRKSQINGSCSCIVSEAIGVGMTQFASQFTNFEDKELDSSLDIHAKSPDPNNLFTLSFFKDSLNVNELFQENNSEIKLRQDVPPEELSLVYRDPQGEIQGPFLGVDIISWLDQGFFDTDLPVCLTDAPEGTPFQHLDELMPHLILRTQPASVVNCVDKSESQIAAGLDLEGSAFMSVVVSSNTLGEQKGSLSEKDIMSDHNGQSDLSSHSDLIVPDDGGFPHSKLDTSAGFASTEELDGPDEEEVLYSGRTSRNSRSLSPKPAARLHDLGQDLSIHHFHTSKTGESPPNHTVPMDDDFHPSGMFWSGIEEAHLKHLSSIFSAVSDQEHLMHTEVGRDTSGEGQHQESLGAMAEFSSVHDPWLNGHGRNRMQCSVLQDAIHENMLSHLEQESSQLILEDHFLSQQLQKQHIQQQNILSLNQKLHLNGSSFDQLQGSHRQQLQRQHSLQPNLLPPCQQRHLSGSLLDGLQGSHQQLSVNQPVHKLEHLLELQIQEQLLQFQHQQQQQQQQLQHAQELHHHSMRLLQQQQHLLLQQQPQQSHMQQLLFEHLLQQQMHEPYVPPPQFDSIRGNNVLDEVLFREHLLHELQQQSLHPLRHHDPSLERLIQTKFGQGLRHQADGMLEVLSHTKHRQALFDQQLLLNRQQEQLHARRFPGGSRQLLGIDEERNVDGIWSDESGQLVMASAGRHPSHSIGADRLDLLQRQQRQSAFDQQLLLNRQQEQLHARRFPGRSRQLLGIDGERNVDGIWSADESGQLVMASAGRHPSHSIGADCFDLLQRQQRQSAFEHLNHADRNIRSHEHIQHGLYEPSLQEMQLPSPIAAHGLSIELASQLRGLDLQDHIGHMHSSVQMDEFPSSSHFHPLQFPEQLNTYHMDAMESCWHEHDGRLPSNLMESQFHQSRRVTERQKRDLKLNLGSEESNTWTAAGNNAEKSKHAMDVLHKSLNVYSLQSLETVNHPVSSYEILESAWPFSRAASDPSFNRLSVQASLGDLFIEGNHGPRGEQVVQEQLMNRGSDGQANNVESGEQLSYRWTSGALMNNEQFLANGNEAKHILFADSSLVGPLSEETMGFLEANEGKTRRHGSKGGLGLHNFEMGVENSCSELINDRLHGFTLPKGSENCVWSHPQGMQDQGGCNLGFQAAEITAPPAKESFVDMLKIGTKKAATEADAAAGLLESDAVLGTKSNKKKGKKGRQIDPSLLGFKVHSPNTHG